MGALRRVIQSIRSGWIFTQQGFKGQEKRQVCKLFDSETCHFDGGREPTPAEPLCCGSGPPASGRKAPGAPPGIQLHWNLPISRIRSELPRIGRNQPKSAQIGSNPPKSAQIRAIHADRELRQKYYFVMMNSISVLNSRTHYGITCGYML